MKHDTLILGISIGLILAFWITIWLAIEYFLFQFETSLSYEGTINRTFIAGTHAHFGKYFNITK